MGKYVVKKTKTGFNFALVAGNNQTIGTSEVYSSKSSCLNGVKSIKNFASKAKIEDNTLLKPVPQKKPKFEIYFDKAKDYRFRLVASNGENVLASEGYKSKSSCKKGIASVIKNSKSDVEEI